MNLQDGDFSVLQDGDFSVLPSPSPLLAVVDELVVLRRFS